MRIAGQSPGLGIPGSQSLDVAFEVEKSTEATPNKATIKIWNLAPLHRQQLEGVGGLTVVLGAGYVDLTSDLFSGDVRVTGEATAGYGTGDQVGLQTHTHGGVQTGGGTSGPPTPGT